MTAEEADFVVHRREVRDGLSLAYLHEGIGGYPLVLLHGYPETKRIWWRNVSALAGAGYEVIVPDLRGHGDSDVDPEDRYDIVTYSRDVEALVRGVLGHERCGVVAGDVGAVVAYDLALRFEDFVDALCWFNTAPPFLPEQYEAAGIELSGFGDAVSRPETDYQVRQGQHTDELAGELDTPQRRRQYIADFYGHRLWGSRGSFTAADVEFMTEPWDTEDRLRAGWAVYQLRFGTRAAAEVPRLFETMPVPALLLYGPEDQVVPEEFMACCEVAFTSRVGPLVVPRAGHFLQWERPDVLNPLVSSFFAGWKHDHGNQAQNPGE
jgi:pimeloyl-ACP methyl ester carboxylesterase